MHVKELISLVLLACGASFAEPLQNTLELGTSVSHFHDGRSLFVNPAALAYQAELNGSDAFTSVTYAGNRADSNEFSLGVGYGYFGLGIESLLSPDPRYRYSLALAAPLSPITYLGIRYSMVRPRLGGAYDSIDVGAQLRPSCYFAFGAVATNLNRPTDPSAVISPQISLGVTVRPASFVSLMVDAQSPYDDFGKSFAYQARVAVEPLKGVELSAGYHTQYQYMLGLRWHLGQASVHLSAQPASSTRFLVAGMQISSRPYPSALAPSTTLKVRIDSQLTDGPARMGFLGKERPTLMELLETLNRALSRPHITRVMVDLASFPLGSASAQEVHEALARLRESGKIVEVFLGNARLKEYLIAAAANRVYLESNGSLLLPGLSAQLYFAKGTLNKIGIEAEMIAEGEYKTAPETFNRSESSAANREMVLSLLKEGEKQLLPILERYRKIDARKWAAIQKQALFGSKDALEHGLIDAEGSFRTEFEAAKNESVVREGTREHSDRLTLPSRVAVIVADGDITESRGGSFPIGSAMGITPEKIQQHLKAALSDPRTRAIVVRVNSPGGEVLPSDQIAQMIEETKKKMPVVVSMGDIAASGGYMISAPATKIFASPLTLTGSIGVFLGKPNLAELYRKIELNKEVLSHAPNSGLLTEHRAWTSEEREILKRRVKQFYDSFVGFVGERRNLSQAEAGKAAKGRVWLGSSAKELKLTDAHGGFREAIREGALLAGVSEDSYEPWLVRSGGGLFDQLEEAEMPLMKSILPRALQNEVFWVSRWAQSPFLYWTPVNSLD